MKPMSDLPSDPETMRAVLKTVRGTSLPGQLHAEAFPSDAATPSGVGMSAEAVTTFGGVDEGVTATNGSNGSPERMPSEVLRDRVIVSAARHTPPPPKAARG
jgi:hypothetical protein